MLLIFGGCLFSEEYGNINGLNKGKDKLLNLVTWTKENHLPIIGLSETNINNKLSNIYNNNDLKEWDFSNIWSK